MLMLSGVSADCQFQSTPPARGATHPQAGDRGAYLFQSTPPARGATGAGNRQKLCAAISIHAPREGGDGKMPNLCEVRCDISIHAPREGGDYTDSFLQQISLISIHAPREGGDLYINSMLYYIYNFNPRPPRGGRR